MFLPVSIEISSFNRKETLRAVLSKLAEQSYPADLMEVVISDDGSEDGLTQMVSSLLPELPYRLTLLQDSHAGPGATHNRGIAAASHELVIMLAADVLPAPDFVAEHVRSHREHPAENVMVSGLLVQSPDMPDSAFQRNWNRMMNRMFEGEKKYLRHGFFFVSNLSFKKSFMMSHGMFREWPPASLEDLELGYRLKSQGMRLERNRRAVGYHYHPVTMEAVAHRAVTEGYYWRQFERHVPEVWVKAKSGHLTPGDGGWPYLEMVWVMAVRNLLANACTIPLLVVPLIKAAERWPFLAVGMRLYTLLFSIYHYDLGRRAWERGEELGIAHSKL